ncbi:hypothetical protein EF910_00500 [Streptomyces sp. WAC07149]|nr:hypothetical protein EF910_00500 [Streptomyces sp. WAC07149]
MNPLGRGGAFPTPSGVHADAGGGGVPRFRRAGLVTLGRAATPGFAYGTTTDPVLHGPWSGGQDGPA